jgi:3-deoxy-D-manno-octulosonate 8-phosphate phosphatase (KDO 8-P phosphatase)
MALLSPADLHERAAGIRLAVFDVDGSLTDGRLWFDAEGRESKAFHVQDGLGLRLLEEHGIAVALITARASAAVLARARDLRLERVYTGIADKRQCLQALCSELDIPLGAVAYLGDDLPDLAVFPLVGLAATPADGHPWVRERAHWVSARTGGGGAARELCDLILGAHGLEDAVLSRYLGR